MAPDRGQIGACFVAIALALAGCHPNRGAETVACTPGEPIWVGCNAACSIGSCWGNPAIRVCDGEVAIASCDDDSALAANDDASWPCASTCPVVRTTCPASGRVTVTVQRGRGDYTCDWAVTSRPLLDGDQLGDAAGGDAAIDDAAIDDAAIDDAAIDDAAIDDAAIDDAAIESDGGEEDGG